jgi:hypothetical protein
VTVMVSLPAVPLMVRLAAATVSVIGAMPAKLNGLRAAVAGMRQRSGVGRGARGIDEPGRRAAEDLERVGGLAAAVVADPAGRSQQPVRRVDNGQGVVAVTAVDDELREAGEGDGRATVDAVAAAVGSSRVDDDRVVSAAAINGENSHREPPVRSSVSSARSAGQANTASVSDRGRLYRTR